MKKFHTEIMAPVSNKTMLDAAIHNGANSVYIGMPGFNARGRADDLTFGDLEDLINAAHTYGLKVYVAFNILIFDDELKDALDAFIRVNELGPDAWIVQDAGLALLMKRIAPDITLHASTQMTIVNNQDILFYSDLDIKRFTLARELSVKEIEYIRAHTEAELEVFIHGSLCIAYSGQCFTSSGFGGRSANRGECAQSCRHEYELFDGSKKISTDGNYLLSPRDLAGFEQVNKLAKLGIAALKIEGRLKSPEYVAAAVKLYSRLLEDQKPEDQNNLISNTGLVFNRNGGLGWLNGVNYKELIDSRINSHTGIYLGKIQYVKPGCHIVVELAGDQPRKFPVNSTGKHNDDRISQNDPKKEIKINKGDGIIVNDIHETYGSRVYDVKLFKKNTANYAELSLSNDFKYNKIKQAMPVYLASSSLVQRELTKSFTDKSRLKHVPVDITFRGKISEKARLVMRDCTDDENCKYGHEVEIISESNIEKSQKQPANIELIKTELGALSSSPYFARNINLDTDPDGFYPNRLIKEMRQQGTIKLTLARIQRHFSNNPAFNKRRPAPLDETELTGFMDQFKINAGKLPVKSGNLSNEDTHNINNLHILVRTPDQLEFVLNLKDTSIHTVYLDFVYGHELADAAAKIKNRGLKCGIATARIYKPGEEKQIKSIVSLSPDSILIRNATALQYISSISNETPIELVGDFSLNITNRAGSMYFLSKKLDRITASHDLVFDHGREQDIARLLDFLSYTPANCVEINVSYYLPSFYMEYCLFSKHLGNGKDSSACGYPCKDHTLLLKDRKGETHPVIADRNCRNTMFNGRQKNLIGYKNGQIGSLLESGVRNFRVELSPDNRQLQNDIEMIKKIHKLITPVNTGL